MPVAGTLMIEPTESESLDELDRFEAMIGIRDEILLKRVNRLKMIIYLKMPLIALILL